ncbi:MAG: squalene/phytoene synthase family protein [Rikenellaceae bacterium]|nr:squalene/phytoene synthase family protein [Rikenellaceae bacterium]
MEKLYEKVSFDISRLVTNRYSTSFSIGTRCLSATIRPAIYGLYGFVRLADEIVDSFHGYDRQSLLEELEKEFHLALDRGISTNPIINSFQKIVRNYKIDNDLVDSFLSSMKMDLHVEKFDDLRLKEYIYGSAEVVELMCLKIFVQGNDTEYQRLKPFAVRLGAAFQKVNFLRDIQTDIIGLHRVYFPVLNDDTINENNKEKILAEIYEDFSIAEQGIRELPSCACLGVYTAYLYYLSLAKAIEETPAEMLMKRRIRVSNRKKALLLGRACLTYKFI